jgi:CHAT domain-containing protein
LLDVLGLRLRARLVILSACETGLGRLAGGDGIVGLHRAFLAAGAAAVASSLWRVSDLATALLMKHLFRALRRGLEPADALRAAQQELRRRFPHPAYWAGFRLEGE